MKMNASIIDQRILEDLVHEARQEMNPDQEKRHKAYREKRDEAFMRADIALIQPHIETLTRVYRQACVTPFCREAARIFLTNMLAAEG